VLEWHVSIFNRATKRSQVRSGQAPDHEAAIKMIVDNGRALAREFGGTTGNVTIDGHSGNAVPLGDTSFSDEELAAKVQFAIDYQKNRMIEIQRRAEEAAAAVPPSPARQPGTTRFSTPASDVGQQWSRISRWLRTHQTKLPAAGAGEEEIAAAEARSGLAWPTELRELFRQANGLAAEAWFPLLPSHYLLNLDQVNDERQLVLRVWSKFTDGTELAETRAGESSGTWLPEFIPFAGLDGYFLFVDTRPGPLHGCVSEFEKVGADDGGPQWISISAMLTDLADALETGARFAEVWSSDVVDGQLAWTYNGNG
jgi:cell wall assembly regulator SMI1